MSTSRALYRKNELDEPVAKERLSEIAGVVLMALALMVVVSLMSHSPDDPAWYFKETSRQTTQNLIGPVGAFMSEALFSFSGLPPTFWPFYWRMVGWSRFWCKRYRFERHEDYRPG